MYMVVSIRKRHLTLALFSSNHIHFKLFDRQETELEGKLIDMEEWGEANSGLYMNGTQIC